jgi:pyrimidine deaminase RibD-like protein
MKSKWNKLKDAVTVTTLEPCVPEDKIFSKIRTF